MVSREPTGNRGCFRLLRPERVYRVFGPPQAAFIGALAIVALEAMGYAGGNESAAFLKEADPPGISQPLTLSAAQSFAFSRNWDLLSAAAGIDAAAAQRLVAHEFPNPTLSISSSKIDADHHPASTSYGNALWDRSYDTIAAINQLIEIGGKRKARQRSARAGLESARAQFYDARRLLDLGVAKAYIAAELAEENKKVLQASAASLAQEARLAALRVNAGEISAADQEQIEITSERFSLDARSAEASAGQARIALEVLLGIAKPRPDCVLADPLAGLALLPEPMPTNSAGARRPDVLAAEAAARKAEADVRLQKAERIPDPTVLAQYEHEPPDAPNTVGLGLSFPLPLWNRNRGNILAAGAALEAARLAYAKEQAQAAAEIATALLAYEDAVERWQRYRDRIRPESEQVRKTKAYAYEKGGASLLDMLVAERDDNDIRMAALQAAADAATAAATLKAATTEINPANLKQ